MSNLTLINLPENIAEFYNRLKSNNVHKEVIIILGGFFKQSDWKKIYTFILMSHVIQKQFSLMNVFNYAESYKKNVYDFLMEDGILEAHKKADIFTDKILQAVNPSKHNYYFALFNLLVNMIKICGVMDQKTLGSSIVKLFDLAKELKPYVKKSKIDELEIYIYIRANISDIKNILRGAYLTL